MILRALKTYGMILADNGSPWFVSGAPNDGWDNDALNAEFRQLKGSDFEAVDVSSLMRDVDADFWRGLGPVGTQAAHSPAGGAARKPRRAGAKPDVVLNV